MITTTLKALRKHDACIDGYNNIACHVAGKEYNSERETYVRHRHNDPIPLAVILDNNGLDDALWALRACEQTPEMVRAERLFAVWCARQVQHLMTDVRSIDALDIAERYAHGNATDDELASAWASARAAVRTAAWAAAMAVAWAAAMAVAGTDAGTAAWTASMAAAMAAAGAAARAAAMAAAGAAARAAAWDAQSKMFRAVFCGDSINIEALKG